MLGTQVEKILKHDLALHANICEKIISCKLQEMFVLGHLSYGSR